MLGKQQATPRRIVFLAYPGVVPLDLIGPWQVFQFANRVCAARSLPYTYTTQLRSMTRNREIEATTGPLFVETDGCRHLGPIDTLVVPATVTIVDDAPAIASGRRRRTLLGLIGRSRRVVSVCTGAFLLAAAGILEGRRATTHWRGAERLASDYPGIRVEPDAIYIRDGNVYTSAGVTAGIDLALALVAEDLGPEIATETARDLVVFVRRPGGQTQFSAALASQTGTSTSFDELVAWAAEHPDHDLSVDALAERMNMSTRHFSRVFRNTVGQTPAACMERIRVDAARQRLEQDNSALEGIASQSGFRSADSMRRVFLRVLRVTPTEYRSRFRRQDATVQAG